MATNKEINEFAAKWLEKYKDPTTPFHEFDDAKFGDECFALGFEMDCGKSFEEAFPDVHPFQSEKNLKSILPKVTDAKLLADAIFSHWRYITHWSYCESPNDKQNCPWFIAAFERLVEITKSDNAETTCAIILFPEFVTIKAEIEKLHTELSMLLLERDELKYVECKNIEMHYMLSLGALEYKAFELHCGMLRLKRKIELIQAKKNRQEKISIAAIEQTLDEEFEEYQEKLNEEIEKMNAALERGKGTPLTAEENKELKTLYRTIVKSLHPDINPDVSEAQVTLFNNAVEAYKNGDLASLRIIKEMVAEPIMPKPSENGLTVLKHEKERLLKTLDLIREQIKDIKNSYPYTLKPIVNSEEEIAKKKAEFEDTIAQLKDMIEVYENRIKEMLR